MTVWRPDEVEAGGDVRTGGDDRRRLPADGEAGPVWLKAGRPRPPLHRSIVIAAGRHSPVPRVDPEAESRRLARDPDPSIAGEPRQLS